MAKRQRAGLLWDVHCCKWMVCSFMVEMGAKIDGTGGVSVKAEHRASDVMKFGIWSAVDKISSISTPRFRAHVLSNAMLDGYRSNCTRVRREGSGVTCEQNRRRLARIPALVHASQSHRGLLGTTSRAKLVEATDQPTIAWPSSAPRGFTFASMLHLN
jgi:hypothetical protein